MFSTLDSYVALFHGLEDVIYISSSHGTHLHALGRTMPMTTSRALRAAARAAQAQAQAVQPQVAQASSTSDGSAHHPLPTAARAAQAQAQAAQAAQAAHPQVAQASSTNDGNAPRPLPTSRQRTGAGAECHVGHPRASIPQHWPGARYPPRSGHRPVGVLA